MPEVPDRSPKMVNDSTRASPHPLAAVPLPYQPGVALIAYIRLRFPGAVDRLTHPADITLPEVCPHPFKRPVVQKLQERLDLP